MSTINTPEFWGTSLEGYLLVALVYFVILFVIRIDPLICAVIAGIGGMATCYALSLVGIPVMYLFLFGGLVILIILGLPFTRGFLDQFHRGRARQSPQTFQAPAPAPVPTSTLPFMQPYQLGENELFHGTSMDAAVRIFSTGLWRVGYSRPPSIWLTSDFTYAASMAKGRDNAAGILVIRHDPNIYLVNDDPTYRYEIEGAVPDEEFYDIKGLTPICILDIEGRRIM